MIRTVDGLDMIPLPGFDLQVPVRRYLGRSASFDIEAHASPGFTFYGNHGEAIVGIGGPIGVLAAYRVDPRLTIDVAAEVPILLSFASNWTRLPRHWWRGRL